MCDKTALYRKQERERKEKRKCKCACCWLINLLAGGRKHCGSARTEWVCFVCFGGEHSSKLSSNVPATAKQGSSTSVWLGRENYTVSSSTSSNKL